MRILKVGIGEFAVEADSNSPMELARQRVNVVTEQLAEIVFNEPPSIGLSAMVSLLATQLSVHPEPQAKTEAIVTVLRTLVEMNMTREEALSIYLIWQKENSYVDIRSKSTLE
jgi:hypothetical protein